ncbi:MAG: hydroxymethylbilane synthase [Verrucomicrobiales bacterium]|jgi:hydroxymethylbilane synthase
MPDNPAQRRNDATPQGKVLNLGTRGSALALAQADMTTAALEAAIPGIQVVRHIIVSTGDARPDLKLSEFQGVLDKGIFTKELEIALESKQIDFAVHSLKDVPTELDDQFKITATLERAETADILIFADPDLKTLKDLPNGATVATSSVRRKRLLLHQRPDLRVIDIRGNVPTRLTKVKNQHEGAAATLLAKAGLLRLGILVDGKLTHGGAELSYQELDEQTFPPAAGQGAVGIEIRSDDSETEQLLQKINHPETNRRVTAERALLAELKAGCQTPIGINTKLEGDQIEMRALIFPEENEAAPPKEARATGTDPIQIARDLLASLT